MSRTDDILHFIQDFIETKGIPPTRREIGHEFGTSTSVADYHLKALAANGRIQLVPNVARGIVVLEPVSPERDKGQSGSVGEQGEREDDEQA